MQIFRGLCLEVITWGPHSHPNTVHHFDSTWMWGENPRIDTIGWLIRYVPGIANCRSRASSSLGDTDLSSSRVCAYKRPHTVGSSSSSRQAVAGRHLELLWRSSKHMVVKIPRLRATDPQQSRGAQPRSTMLRSCSLFDCWYLRHQSNACCNSRPNELSNVRSLAVCGPRDIISWCGARHANIASTLCSPKYSREASSSASAQISCQRIATRMSSWDTIWACATSVFSSGECWHIWSSTAFAVDWRISWADELATVNEYTTACGCARPTRDKSLRIWGHVHSAIHTQWHSSGDLRSESLIVQMKPCNDLRHDLRHSHSSVYSSPATHTPAAKCPEATAQNPFPRSQRPVCIELPPLNSMRAVTWAQCPYLNHRVSNRRTSSSEPRTSSAIERKKPETAGVMCSSSRFLGVNLTERPIRGPCCI